MNLEKYGPMFGELLASDQTVALDEGLSNPLMFDKLKSLSVESAFAHTEVRDQPMAALCLSGIWLFNNYLDESHSISQDNKSPTGSYWHGIMHRREGDFPNAKYWFRQVGEHPVFEIIDEQMGANEKMYQSPQLADLASSGYDPFELVDHCRTVLRSETESKSPGGEEEPNDDLRQFCEMVSNLEWWALFDYCYEQAI